MEHTISPRIADRLCSFLGHPPQCPHGRPIPPGPCCERHDREIKPLVAPLTEARIGERYRIVFIPDPVVWTEVPERLAGLYRQRTRWHRGLLECLKRNWRMLGRPEYGPVGMLGLPYNLLFEAIGPLVEVAGYIALVVAIALGDVNVRFIVLFFLLAVGYGVFLSVASILLDQMRLSAFGIRRDMSRLVLYAFLETFGYRQLQAFWRARATIDFLRKKRGWGEMRREGFDST